jgi:hypothetical protein
VVPRHPPSTLEEITKYLFVSNALPGPIMLSHQPGLPVAESVRESLNTVYLMAGWRRFAEGGLGTVIGRRPTATMLPRKMGRFWEPDFQRPTTHSILTSVK